MPTTGHGIEYPASTGHTRLWEHFQTLADSVEDALDDYEASTAWTPVWNTTFTSFGAGGINEGHYTQIGKLLHVAFRCEIGTGPTIGASVAQLALPVAVWSAFPSGSANQLAIGSWHIRDASVTGYWAGTIHTDTAGGTTCTFSAAWSAAPNQRVSNTMPLTWAVGDSFSGNMTYRVA